MSLGQYFEQFLADCYRLSLMANLSTSLSMLEKSCLGFEKTNHIHFGVIWLQCKHLFDPESTKSQIWLNCATMLGQGVEGGARRITGTALILSG